MDPSLPSSRSSSLDEDHYRQLSEVTPIQVSPQFRISSPKQRSSVSEMTSMISSVSNQLLSTLTPLVPQFEVKERASNRVVHDDPFWFLVVAKKDSTDPLNKGEKEIEEDFMEVEFEELVDRDFVILKAPNCSHWKPRYESMQKAMQRMTKNSLKAIKEHGLNNDKCITSEILNELLETQKKVKFERSFLFTTSVCSAKSQRPYQEDAYFYQEKPESILLGVQDGHCGARVATYVAAHFSEKFYAALEFADKNVHQAFEHSIDAIHKEIAAQKELGDMGTVAVFAYIDKVAKEIFVATVGDAEGKIFRICQEERRSIPLSCIRNWGKEKEALRVSIAENDPSFAEIWPLMRDPKFLYYPKPGGLNVSRSLGDCDLRARSKYATIIHKPKITHHKFFPDDLFVFGSDGLWDEVSDKEVIDVFLKKPGSLKLAQNLVNYVIKVKKGRDNVTVIAIKVAQMTKSYSNALGSLSLQ